MKIGFDVQPLQTEMSKNRGIGRFARNIVDGFIAKNNDDIIKLYFNNNYDKIPFEIKSNLESTIINYSQKNEESTINNLIQFLKYYSANLDILQILSPFEGYPSNKPVITSYLERLPSSKCGY